MPDAKAVRKEENFFQRTIRRIQQYFRETVGELRKVSWPTRQEAFNLTKIVLVVIGLMAIFLGILDLIFSKLIGFILSL